MLLLLAIALDNRLKIQHYTVEAAAISQPVRLCLLTDLHSGFSKQIASTISERVSVELGEAAKPNASNIAAVNTAPFQGGLTRWHAKLAVCRTLQECWQAGLI